jgi:cytochrome c oxidase accessory protein FixG
LTSASAKRARTTGTLDLYERWRKIYPLWVEGGFQRWRRVTLVLLLLLFYVTPWLQWGERPLIWLNLPERKFSLLWATFWPQEFVLFSWLLISAAFALFFFTVIAGRVWCGWLCPQTVWTLCYQWIEKAIEGDRSARMRLDRGPWNTARLGKKALKFALWGLLAFSIAVTFEGYFIPIRDLLPKIARYDLLPIEKFWLFFPTVASFLMQGVLREQVCFHMCPYARFQSVMFDDETLIISYDGERGEPRGSRPRGTSSAAAGKGDCIDCRMCVSVCPTGIDIRDGLQYQCIACAACIDACNHVMDQLGYERNLIRYSALHADRHQPRSWLRPRLFGYGAVMLAMLGAVAFALSQRVPLALDVIRDRSRMYREFWDGTVENVYTLKIMNREESDRRYRISSSADWPLQLETASGSTEVQVEAGRQHDVTVRLVAAPELVREGGTVVEFRVEALGEPAYHVSSREPLPYAARAGCRLVTPGGGDGLPWYRHGWPWFIVGLLGISVAGSLATVALALHGRDMPVHESGDPDGEILAALLAREDRATALGLRGELVLDPEAGRATVTLAGDGLADVAGLDLELRHATLAPLDRRARLLRTAPGRYEGPLAALPRGRYYASVEPAADDAVDDAAPDWRLARSFFAGSAGRLALGEGSSAQ